MAEADPQIVDAQRDVRARRAAYELDRQFGLSSAANLARTEACKRFAPAATRIMEDHWVAGRSKDERTRFTNAAAQVLHAFDRARPRAGVCRATNFEEQG